MSLVRYAVIGCGDHAWKGHIEPGFKVPGLELYGLYDQKQEAIDETLGKIERAGQMAPRYASSHRAGLASIALDKSIQLVVIATPDADHLEGLKQALSWGKHVLVEKPLVTRPEEVPELVEILTDAQRKGLVVTSCHPRRFDSPYVWIKRNLPELIARFGAVVSVVLDFTYHKPSARKAGLHTGLMMDHVNHEFDFVNWLLGHAPTVLERVHDSEVAYAVTGQREGPLWLSFQGSRKLEERRYAETIYLRFERGEIEVNCETGRVVQNEVHPGHNEPHAGPKEESWISPTDYDRRFGSMMANVCDAVLGLGPNYLTVPELIANTSAGAHLTTHGRWDYYPGA